jgi:hypothetical protein
MKFVAATPFLDSITTWRGCASGPIASGDSVSGRQLDLCGTQRRFSLLISDEAPHHRSVFSAGEEKEGGSHITVIAYIDTPSCNYSYL